MLEQLPPHSIEAEEAVLGSLLVDGEAYWQVAGLLASDFYREKNADVFGAMKALVARGRAIDQLTVATELADKQKLEAIGGGAYLSHLVGVTPTSVHIEHYAGIVREMSLRRKLIVAGQRVQAMAFGGGDDLVNRAMEAFIEVARGSSSSDLVTPKMRAEQAMERYQRIAELQGGPNLSLGFPALDELGGAGPADVIILGGYPGVGKTTVLMQMMRAMAEVGPVLFVSLEMSRSGLDNREIGRLLGVQTKEIARGKYEGRLLDLILSDGIGGLSEMGVYLYLPARATVMDIEAVGRRMQMQYGLVAMGVDYIQLIDAPGKEYERVSSVSQSLKAMAKALDIPVLVASQLHRPQGHDTLRLPGMMDLRGSGYIEQDADLVILLHRPDAFITETEWERRYSNKPYPRGQATFMVVKMRQGGVRLDIPLVWNDKKQEYVEGGN